MAAVVMVVTGGAWGWVKGTGLDREYLATALEDFEFDNTCTHGQPGVGYLDVAISTCWLPVLILPSTVWSSGSHQLMGYL